MFNTTLMMAHRTTLAMGKLGHDHTPGSLQCMVFPLSFNSSQSASVTRNTNGNEQNIVQTAVKEYEKEPATGCLLLHTGRPTCPQQNVQPVQTQQLLVVKLVTFGINDVHAHLEAINL